MLPSHLAALNVRALLVEERQHLGLGARPHLLQLHRIAQVGEVGLLEIDFLDQPAVNPELDRADLFLGGLLGRRPARSSRHGRRAKVAEPARRNLARQTIDPARDAVAWQRQHDRRAFA